MSYNLHSFKHKIQESIEPFKYQTKKPTQLACYNDHPGFITQNIGTSLPHTYVDTESELFNITKPNSKYPPHQQPNHKNSIISPNCNTKIQTHHTRKKKPCNILSGVNINRFQPLHSNVQDLKTIHSNNYIGLNSRNYKEK